MIKDRILFLARKMATGTALMGTTNSKSLLMIGTIGASLLMCSAPSAWASWTVTYELTDGKDTYDSGSQNGTNGVVNWPLGVQTGQTFYRFPDEGTGSNDVFLNSAGKVKFTWQWTGATASRPDKLNLIAVPVGVFFSLGMLLSIQRHDAKTF